MYYTVPFILYRLFLFFNNPIQRKCLRFLSNFVCFCSEMKHLEPARQMLDLAKSFAVICLIPFLYFLEIPKFLSAMFPYLYLFA
jgi:hypothetical protein